MKNPIDIDINTGKIKIDYDYYLLKEKLKTDINFNFFNDIKNDNYKIKTKFQLNDNNGILEYGEILIKSNTTKEILKIEIKEIKNKIKISPIFQKVGTNTINFVNSNIEWLIYFNKILLILGNELKNKVLPDKEEIFQRLKSETEKLKNQKV